MRFCKTDVDLYETNTTNYTLNFYQKASFFLAVHFTTFEFCFKYFSFKVYTTNKNNTVWNSQRFVLPVIFWHLHIYSGVKALFHLNCLRCQSSHWVRHQWLPVLGLIHLVIHCLMTQHRQDEVLEEYSVQARSTVYN